MTGVVPNSHKGESRRKSFFSPSRKGGEEAKQKLENPSSGNNSEPLSPASRGKTRSLTLGSKFFQKLFSRKPEEVLSGSDVEVPDPLDYTPPIFLRKRRPGLEPYHKVPYEVSSSSDQLPSSPLGKLRRRSSEEDLRSTGFDQKTASKLRFFARNLPQKVHIKCYKENVPLDFLCTGYDLKEYRYGLKECELVFLQPEKQNNLPISFHGVYNIDHLITLFSKRGIELYKERKVAIPQIVEDVSSTMACFFLTHGLRETEERIDFFKDALSLLNRSFFLLFGLGASLEEACAFLEDPRNELAFYKAMEKIDDLEASWYDDVLIISWGLDNIEEMQRLSLETLQERFFSMCDFFVLLKNGNVCLKTISWVVERLLTPFAESLLKNFSLPQANKEKLSEYLRVLTEKNA